jgi:chromosome segregation ATPase
MIKNNDFFDFQNKEIKKLKNSVISYKKINGELNKKVQRNDNSFIENSIILRKYKELENNYSSLNNDYLEIQENLKEKNKIISDFQQLTEKDTIKFKQLNIQNNELKNVIKAYELSNNNLRELNKLQEQKIKELEMKYDELKNDLKSFNRNTKDKNNNENTILKNQIDSLNKQIKQLSEQLKEKEQNYVIEIKNKDNEINTLLEKINENKEKIIKIEDLNEEINNIKLENNKLNQYLKEIKDENNEKKNIIKKLNNCILEYNQTIIQSKNKLTDRDKSYENIEKEKDKLILKLTEVTNEKSKLEEKHKIFIEENRIQNSVYEEKISEIIKENNNKCDEINKLNEIIKTLKEDNKEIKSIPLDLEKSNIYLLNIRERQNELNQKISSLNDIIYEKEAIIETLKDKYNQKVSYYKLKISENKNRINNLMNNLIELKYYVNELERLLENKHINNTFSGKKVRRNSSMERIDKNKYNSIDFYNGSCVDNEKYNSQLIDSLKSMIMKIDNKLNESYRNEDEILKNCK